MGFLFIFPVVNGSTNFRIPTDRNVRKCKSFPWGSLLGFEKEKKPGIETKAWIETIIDSRFHTELYHTDSLKIQFKILPVKSVIIQRFGM